MESEEKGGRRNGRQPLSPPRRPAPLTQGSRGEGACLPLVVYLRAGAVELFEEQLIQIIQARWQTTLHKPIDAVQGKDKRKDISLQKVNTDYFRIYTQSSI